MSDLSRTPAARRRPRPGACRFGLPRWAALLAGFALVSAPDAASAEAQPEQAPPVMGEEILAAQPRALVERLRQKKVVTLQDIGAARARDDDLIVGFVLFESDKQKVYRFLSQTTRQVEYRPELTSIETLSRDAEGPVDRQSIRIVFRRFVYHLRWHLDPVGYRLRWELDESRHNDLDRVRGSWELFDLENGGTLGRFTASVDVGKAVPRMLQDYITRRNLPRTMEDNRRWVDSGGTYRP